MLRQALIALTLSATLAACASGPRTRINPPTASIQQLELRDDGSWQLTLRVQNYSNVTTTVASIDATLRLDGRDAGRLQLAPELDISAERADVARTAMAANGELPKAAFAYTLEGTITTSEPRGSYPFSHSSRLSPVPGTPGTYR